MNEIGDARRGSWKKIHRPVSNTSPAAVCNEKILICQICWLHCDRMGGHNEQTKYDWKGIKIFMQYCKTTQKRLSLEMTIIFLVQIHAFC